MQADENVSFWVLAVRDAFIEASSEQTEHRIDKWKSSAVQTQGIRWICMFHHWEWEEIRST